MSDVGHKELELRDRDHCYLPVVRPFFFHDDGVLRSYMKELDLLSLNFIKPFLKLFE